MYFVYLLRSIRFPEKRYVGFTKNIEVRLEEHNLGQSFHTAKYKPWKLATYIGFENKDRAAMFEQYLKSGSGRVFVKKHLI